jgi:hypothetical protein
MEEEQVKRFLYSKQEIKSLILSDLASRGRKIEGETRLVLQPLLVTFEVFEPKGQDKNDSNAKRNRP